MVTTGGQRALVGRIPVRVGLDGTNRLGTSHLEGPDLESVIVATPPGS